MSDAAIVYLVLGAVVALFIWNKVPSRWSPSGSALTLAATGVLSLDQALAGFGDTTVLFIAALFVVSEGIDSTGVTTWAGQQLIDRAGASRTRLIILMMLLVALLTAVISVNGAVAALLPMVVVIALRVGASTFQPADALGLWRPRRLVARPYRHSGSHPRLRRRDRGRRGRVQLFRVRSGRRPGGDRCDRDRRPLRYPSPPRRVLRIRSLPISATTPGPSSISTRSANGWRGSRSRTARRWSTTRLLRSISTHSPISAWLESKGSVAWLCLRTHRSGWAS